MAGARTIPFATAVGGWRIATPAGIKVSGAFNDHLETRRTGRLVLVSRKRAAETGGPCSGGRVCALKRYLKFRFVPSVPLSVTISVAEPIFEDHWKTGE